MNKEKMYEILYRKGLYNVKNGTKKWKWAIVDTELNIYERAGASAVYMIKCLLGNPNIDGNKIPSAIKSSLRYYLNTRIDIKGKKARFSYKKVSSTIYNSLQSGKSVSDILNIIGGGTRSGLNSYIKKNFNKIPITKPVIKNTSIDEFTKFQSNNNFTVAQYEDTISQLKD